MFLKANLDYIQNTKDEVRFSIGFVPSLNTQSCNRRPLCSTLKFENLRSPKKSLKKIKFIMQFFCAEAIVFSKKN